MSYPVYYVPAGDVLPIFFDTFDGGTGASVTLTGLAVTDIEIYKDGSTTQRASDAGYTLLDTDGIDFDGVTGIHGFSIDTGDNTDANFYAVGAWYHVVVSSVTVDSQTVNFIAAAFRIMAAEGTAGVPDCNVSHISDDSTAADNLELMYDGTGYAGGTTKLDVNVATITNGAITAAAIATGAIDADAIADNAIDAGAIAADAITAAKIANGAIDAATFAADVDAEIATYIWNAATASYGGAGTYGQAVEDTLADTNELQADWVNGGRLDLILDARASQTSVDTIDDFLDTEVAAILADTNELQTDWADGGRLDLILDAASAPSAADVADAVWDEALGDHLGVGATGTALNAAGSAGDPWATAIPGAYGSGTAGKILGDNINATISSRATQTSVDTIDDLLDTEVAAILADTNELQTDLVNGGRLDLLIDAILEDTAAMPTAAGIADAVWDEASTGHTDAGKAGQQLWTDVDAILADTNELQTDDYPTSIAAVKADTAAILEDTGTTLQAELDGIQADTEDLQTQIGTAGAGLTAINLPDQTMNITGNITGNLSGSVGSVTGAVGSVTGNVTGSVGSLATQAKADVNAEVVDVLRTDTIPDSYAADGAQPTIAQALLAVLQFLTEKAVSGTTVTVKKPDGTTTAMTLTLDDGTTPTAITRSA